jgi:uncharacterized phage protein (TIGR02218 family)
MHSEFSNTLDSSTPVELYAFAQGVNRYLYNSGIETFTRLGQDYLPSNIKRSNIRQTSNVFKNSVKFTFPRGNEFASQFIGFAPEELTSATVFQRDFNDPDEEYLTSWKGRVVGAETSENEIILECESIFTSVRRPGLREVFELTCRRTLYERGCNVNREAYKHTGAVLSIGSNSVDITVNGASSQADGYYTGGIFIVDGIMRYIVDHSSDVVTITRPIASLVGGVDVDIYPGCDGLTGTCNTKFSNLDNFGGFPYIPIRNPFNGSSIM